MTKSVSLITKKKNYPHENKPSDFCYEKKHTLTCSS